MNTTFTLPTAAEMLEILKTLFSESLTAHIKNSPGTYHYYQACAYGTALQKMGMSRDDVERFAAEIRTKI